MLKLSDELHSTHNQDGAVVLDVLHGQMFRLNLVGSRMLELIEQSFTETEIAERVSQEFSVSSEIVAADLREFLFHLEKYRLLEIRPASR